MKIQDACRESILSYLYYRDEDLLELSTYLAKVYKNPKTYLNVLEDQVEDSKLEEDEKRSSKAKIEDFSAIVY